MKRIIPLVLCLWASSVLAATELPVTINGNTYTASLTENNFLASRIDDIPGQEIGEHYYGQIEIVPGSWIRVSKISGRWSGLASVYGSVYVVDQPVMSSVSGAQTASIASPAVAASEFEDEMGGCGTAEHGQLMSFSMVSEVQPAVTSAATFASFCSESGDQVGDVCILPEVEFVFDTAFQAKFPSNYAAKALELINTASALFQLDRNDLTDFTGDNGANMAIDATKITFLTSEVFSTTTDPFAFLGDIQLKKRNSQLSFVDNPRALLHVVTGRTFVDGTAGVAFVRAMCEDDGDSSGTSAVVGTNIGLTAIVVAHELIHNLGAYHDGDSGAGYDNTACPFNTTVNGMGATVPAAGPNIMSPVVSTGFTGLSDCSVLQIIDEVESLPSPELCFNFPADLAVSDAAPSAPVNASVGDTFSASYMVSVNDEGDLPVTQVKMTGTSNVGAQFTNVTANGNACSIGVNNGYPNTSYDCLMNSSVGDSVAININGTITGFNAQATTEHIATVSTSNITDHLMDDNVTSTATAVLGMLSAPPPPITSNASSGGGGGGGGGGSLGWPLLLGLFGLLFRRQY